MLIEFLLILAAVLVASLIASFIEFKIRNGSRPFIGLIIVEAIVVYLCFDRASDWFGNIIMLIMMTLPVIIAWQVVRYSYRAYAENKNRKLIQKQQMELVKRYKDNRAELISQYGQPTKSIQLRDYDLDGDVDVFEDRQIIKLGKKIIPFSSIKGHSFDKDIAIKKGRQFFNAYGGGTITGESHGHYSSFMNDYKGSSKGKMSFHYSGVIVSEDDKVKDSQTVYINTDSIANPVISFYIGEDKHAAKEIDGILKIIEEKNRS